MYERNWPTQILSNIIITVINKGGINEKDSDILISFGPFIRHFSLFNSLSKRFFKKDELHLKAPRPRYVHLFRHLDT